jgi:hypothetical protein
MKEDVKDKISAHSPARVELSDWSEFGSFSIYPSEADRLLEEGVLVGTVYTNPNFSTVDEHGHASGHDIDLVRLLVWGCLKVNADEHTVAYDEELCSAATSLYATVAKQLVATRRAPVSATLVRQEALDIQDDWIKKASAADPRRRIKIRIRSFPNLETALLELSRKQIDILIGSITKALKRLSDNGNIRFTDGYYSFTTRLYAREGSAQRAAQWTDWLGTSRKVGVISNSTNHWLANSLSEEAGVEQLDLKVVPFDTFSQLEEPFDRNDIDGLLIDNLLSDAQLKRTVPLSGIEDTAAWRHYIKEQIGGWRGAGACSSYF